MSKKENQKQKYTQLNIEGEPIQGLPEVRTSDGYITPFDRQKIVEQLKKETKLTEKIFNTESISNKLAQEVAKEAENRIRKLNVKQLSGPLIREIVNNILLEHSQNGETHNENARIYRNVSTRVGTPVFDAFNMDIGGGFESNENANLIGNPETSHKKKADKISKEQYLLTMPTEQADAHLNGDLHIHDLEYFATRPFCMDWDLRYFLYYGLMPDGSGRKSSVAGPSKKPEVAILHAVKALGSAQTNWAGGQGFYNFLTFMAPYMENKSYKEIKQLMQMFVYEMTQMMVARGGQLVFSSVQLTPGIPDLWKDKPIVKHGQIGPNTYGSYEKEVQQMFKALMEVMIQGDYWGKPFNFPKPEVNIKEEFLSPEYDEQWNLAYKLAAKHGTPYFDNEIPEYRGGDEGVSCYQCLAEDEEIIYMDEGGYKVKEISEVFVEAKGNGIEEDLNGVEFAPLNDSKSPSMSKDIKLENRDFEGVMRKQYSGKLKEITLKSGRKIKVTSDHPIITLEGAVFKKKRANKIKEDDYLPVIEELPSPSVKEKIDVKKILNEKYKLDEKSGKVAVKDSKKIIPKEIEVDKDLATFLGLYLAEGCSDESGRRKTVRLSFGKDEDELIEKAEKAIEETFQISPIKTEEKTAISLVVNSKTIYYLLEELGAGKASKTKSIPRTVFNWKEEHIAQYLKFAFKGDGNIDTTGRGNAIRIKLRSEKAIKDIIALSKRINVQMNYEERKVKVKHPHKNEKYKISVYEAKITSQSQIEKFVNSTKYGREALRNKNVSATGIFEQIPIKETNVELNYTKYPSQYKNRQVIGEKLLNSQDGLVEILKDSKIHVLPVKEIEEVDYEGYVYDLVEVKENHNFANAQGIITGNCCAYQFSANEDTDNKFNEKLHFEDGHHFTMGGWQVITLNCPRAAYRAEGDDDKLFSELKNQMDTAVEVFKTKKKWMGLMQEKNRLPFATQRPKDPSTGEPGKPAADLSQLVWTIGVLGINDMVRYHTGQQLHESSDAVRFAIRTMAEMENYARFLEKEHNMDIALARTPAESTVQRFAVSDLLNNKFRDKAKEVVRGDYEKAKHQLKNERDIPVYYTNGTHVPVDADISLGKRINIEHKFFPIVDGGNIMHIWLGESSPNPEGMRSLTEKIAKNTQSGYFAYTKDMTICNDDYNVESGLKDNCPSCGSNNIDYISRVTGYLQAVSGWNSAKKQELRDRKKYNQSEIDTEN